MKAQQHPEVTEYLAERNGKASKARWSKTTDPAERSKALATMPKAKCPECKKRFGRQNIARHRRAAHGVTL